MANVSGGELVVRTLLAAGVDNIFTLYGGHLETIFQSIREHRLAFLDVRHEVAAGHAAEGYARSQRRLGVALITAGPGFTNALTSITNAWLDRTPVLYICASIPQPYAEANVVQGGFDQVAMATPVTKWAHRVTATGDIPPCALPPAIRRGQYYWTFPWMFPTPPSPQMQSQFPALSSSMINAHPMARLSRPRWRFWPMRDDP